MNIEEIKAKYEARVEEMTARRIERTKQLRKFARTHSKHELVQLIPARIHCLNEKSSNTEVINFIVECELPYPTTPRALR